MRAKVLKNADMARIGRSNVWASNGFPANECRNGYFSKVVRACGYSTERGSNRTSKWLKGPQNGVSDVFDIFLAGGEGYTSKRI